MGIEAFLTVKVLQYNQVRIIVLSIYNDTVTPGVKKIHDIVLWYVVHPSTPYYSGAPFKSFGTPLGVQYTRLKSTALDKLQLLCLSSIYGIGSIPSFLMMMNVM